MKILVLVAYVVFAIRRLITYLHIFQQEEYDSPRFIRWMIRRGAFDRRATSILAAVSFATLFRILPAPTAQVLTGLTFLILAYFESDPRSASKKHLVMTQRAKRTLGVASLAGALLGLTASIWSGSIWIWIIPVQLLPFSLVLSNLILTPLENRVQQQYWHQAHNKLGQLRPTTIGITVSYGKTSVKHILGHILETHAPTLITPGSVNTTMGIARVIRQQLGPHHRFFVCEMGAYGLGSISNLTQLAQPDLAIVTAVGHAHYERFKTLDAVAQAKFEIAEAVMRVGGKVVVAEDILKLPFPHEFANRHERSIVAVGTSPACALRIQTIQQLRTGIEVGVTWGGTTYTLQAPLFGKHQALNIGLAFAAACELGVDPGHAKIALTSVAQTNHRLEVKRQPRGSMVIDDAYNSNPVGFANALQILDLLREEGGRRILVTPGMVELGSAHDDEHARIGALAASHVDVFVPVMHERISTMTAAYKAGNPQGSVIPCSSFAEAQAWLAANLGPQDAVLVENDLPDLYEKKFNL